jgi:hypothetical protein
MVTIMRHAPPVAPTALLPILVTSPEPDIVPQHEAPPPAASTDLVDLTTKLSET